MSTNANNRAIQPYLFFGGRCEEALKFYQQALGAKVDMMMRFKETPEPTDCPADWADKIMHANLTLGETTIMASDGCWQEKQTAFKGFALSLSVPNESEADRRFTALSKGGEVRMPMEKTFFAKRFGMVSDRFGVSWMVIVPEECVGAKKLETAIA